MNIAIVGTGTMGRIVRDMALKNPGIDRVCNIEPALGESLYDIAFPDVVIDFSHPDALNDICEFALSEKGTVGVVFATTGFSIEDEKKIHNLSQKVPVIKCSNFSYGINSMKKIIEFAARFFDGRCDMEIMEKHHNQKADAPSGTAILLADSIDPKHLRPRIYGRWGEGKRKNEIGIHSIRGGTIFGEHTVIFAMKDEVIEIKHTAFSKKVFAKGSIEAALWICGKEPGLYHIEDVFY